MTDFLQSLLERKKAAEEQRNKAQKEIDFLNRVIEEYKLTKGEKNPPLTDKTQKALYLKNCIRESIAAHDKGITTQRLHSVISAYEEEEVNYNTFRSYLTEMKNNGLIEQDSNRKWHSKN